ncbi:hypothetical protein VHEMI02995 [[Torrubiella] hemipterigena]|uniref:Uncharacterized protein n=1 Tax=[Torrubiella] hemipterigena TaxID=1531966 RepID=A0A0A1SR84_9HYPO|nr:hypothetical protein VHEMI02995 [[Torrubiella] hemipterigena]
MFDIDDVPPVNGPGSEIAPDSSDPNADLLTGVQNVTAEQFRDYDKLTIGTSPVVADNGEPNADLFSATQQTTEEEANDDDLYTRLQSITDEQLLEYEYDMLELGIPPLVEPDIDPDSSDPNDALFIRLQNITAQQLRDYYDSLDTDIAPVGTDDSKPPNADILGDILPTVEEEPNADIFIGLEHTEEQRQDYNKLKDLAAKVARSKALLAEYEARVGLARDLVRQPWTLETERKMEQLQHLMRWVDAAKQAYNEFDAKVKLKYSRDV